MTTDRVGRTFSSTIQVVAHLGLEINLSTPDCFKGDIHLCLQTKLKEISARIKVQDNNGASFNMATDSVNTVFVDGSIEELVSILLQIAAALTVFRLWNTQNMSQSSAEKRIPLHSLQLFKS